MQRLATNSTTTNKDLMLLCLAVHGIIDIDIPEQIEDENILQADELLSESNFTKLNHRNFQVNLFQSNPMNFQLNLFHFKNILTFFNQDVIFCVLKF